MPVLRSFRRSAYSCDGVRSMISPQSHRQMQLIGVDLDQRR